jgi:ABC-type sugar transport system substrate-binding protein
MLGTNEGSAIGIVNAAREMGTEGVTIIGEDSGKAQTYAIRDGLMAGAITQNPFGIGYETVKAAVAAKNGEPLPKIFSTMINHTLTTPKFRLSFTIDPNTVAARLVRLRHHLTF